MSKVDLSSFSDEYKIYLSNINNLFVRNREGSELLERWKKSYFFRPICVENEPVESAKRDGENRFLRNILTNIEHFKLLMENK